VAVMDAPLPLPDVSERKVVNPCTVYKFSLLVAVEIVSDSLSLRSPSPVNLATIPTAVKLKIHEVAPLLTLRSPSGPISSGCHQFFLLLQTASVKEGAILADH